MSLLPRATLAAVLTIALLLPTAAPASKPCIRSCRQQGRTCTAAARADGVAARASCKPLSTKQRKACKKTARRTRKAGLRQCRAGVTTCRGCCRSGGDATTCRLQPPLGPPPCAGSIPADLGPSSTYRAYTKFSDHLYDDVAISNRGWRAVATYGSEIAYFGRDQEAPLFVKQGVPSFYTTAAIADDGSAFVVAGHDSVSYFECDGPEPAWVRRLDEEGSDGEEFGIVAMSASGEWITVATCSVAYLFHRTGSAPVLTTSLPTRSCSGAGGTAISRSGQYWIAMLSDARLALLDHQGVVWTRDFGPAAIGERLPWAFDVADDGSVAVTTADRFGEAAQVVVLQGTTGATRWATEIPTRYPLGARFSADGRRLAIGGSAVVFVDDTSQPPTFGSGGDWSFTKQLEFDQASVFPGSLIFPGSGLPGYDEVPLGGGAPIEPDVGTSVQFDVTADGSYVAASITEGMGLFHRQFAEPLRRFHGVLPYKADALDLSADGSWLVVQFPDVMVRFELPPTEVIRIPVPVSFRVAGADAGDLIAPLSGGLAVDSWLLKPGRAATVQQDWDLWGVPGLSAAPFLLTAALCQGDTHWTARHDLADGDVAVHDVREIHAPRCFASGLSGLQAMYLKSSLSADPGREMSRDVEVFASVEVSLVQ